jgi:hypothetical protein
VLRIRDPDTVKRLEFNPDIQETLDGLMNAKIRQETKKTIIKKLTDGSPCCIYGGIPTLEIANKLDGATRIERYCDS